MFLQLLSQLPLRTGERTEDEKLDFQHAFGNVFDSEGKEEVQVGDEFIENATRLERESKKESSRAQSGVFVIPPTASQPDGNHSARIQGKDDRRVHRETETQGRRRQTQ